jgi:hypothetical protein
MMQKNKFLLVFVIIFYFIAILGNIIDQYVSFLSWADELSAILLFVLYINKFKKLDRYDRKILKLLFLFFIVGLIPTFLYKIQRDNIVLIKDIVLFSKFFVGMYDYPDDVVNRFYSLAAINKMNYIISLLNENGYDVDIYSLSNSKESTFKFSREKKVEIGRNILYLTPTLGTSCKIGKALRIILSYCWLMMKILCNARTNDYILIYHTLEGIVPLSIVKRLKKLRYVLEVEEIYSEMPNSNGSNKKKELRFISRADKYIVVSHLLKDKLPPRDSMIIYGNYKFVDDANSYIKKNNKINLLFSGSLDLTRGVFQAIESMYFLPENYVLNISGVGSKSSVYLVQKKIDELNTFRNKVVCRYLGKLDDNDYRLLLSSSDLALNTQIEGEYAQFLFNKLII